MTAITILALTTRISTTPLQQWLQSEEDYDLSNLDGSQLDQVRATLLQRLTAERMDWGRAFGLGSDSILSSLSYTDGSGHTTTMRFCATTIGAMPPEGYPLFIALHGGGASPLNESQYQSMQTYYKGCIAQGIYVAVRAVDDTVPNCHYVAASYPLYDRLIEAMISCRGVDPNRVYLLGYSAGGDGVYNIAPRMADRFAGANMSAGHPNGVSGINLNNMFFLMQVGELDCAYNRNALAVQFGQQLAGIGRTYGISLRYQVNIHSTSLHSEVADNDPSAPTHTVMADPDTWLQKSWRTIQWRDNTVWTLQQGWHTVTSSFGGVWNTPTGPRTIDDHTDGNGYTPSAYALNNPPLAIDGKELSRANYPHGITFSSGYPGMRLYVPFGMGYGGITDDGRKQVERDTNAPRILSAVRRTPWPTRVIWDTRTSAEREGERSNLFYWLKIPAALRKATSSPLDVSLANNVITVTAGVTEMAFRLRPGMIDWTRPVTVTAGGHSYQARPIATMATLARTLLERSDPSYTFDGQVVLSRGHVYPPAVTRTSPVVGGSFDAFNDTATALARCAPISRIAIRHGEIIDRLQPFYGPERVPGPGRGGSGGAEAVFDLPEGDQLTKVRVITGDWYGARYVVQLQFTSMNGRVSPVYGSAAHATNLQTSDIVCQPGEQILGFLGSTRLGATSTGGQSRYVSSLGVLIGKTGAV